MLGGRRAEDYTYGEPQIGPDRAVRPQGGGHRRGLADNCRSHQQSRAELSVQLDLRLRPPCQHPGTGIEDDLAGSM
jgi:hypothetical protein